MFNYVAIYFIYIKKNNSRHLL